MSLSKSSTSKVDLSSYLVRSQSLLDRTPHLRSRFGNLLSDSFLDFVDTKAVLTQAEILECAIPFPNWRQMVTVGGEVNLESFLDVGKQTLDWIKADLPLDNQALILDFGVGCARTARHLFRYSDKITLYGCDVDREAIAYCEQALPFMRSSATTNKPPLPYNDDFFDCIYSISVFSHLNLAAFDAWAHEMYRILKCGGKLIFTFHGPSAYHKIATQNLSESLVIGNWRENYAETKDFAGEFLWLPQVVGSTDIDKSSYGISFTSDDFIEARYSNLFKKLKVEHSVGDWQDMIILVKI
jgi:SAM-dependent methyltransferase